MKERRKGRGEKLVRFLKEEEGMETVEYALVAALVIAVTVMVWTQLGDAVRSRIQALTAAIS